MKKLIMTASLLLASSPALLACAACFGKSDSNMARSLNASIFTLMGVVGVVLAGAASFFVFLAKRAATYSQNEQKTTSSSELQT
ncbi:MAG TPA: hypothetical protein VH619_17680 [Verrucomicrobiae bacterium]|jgi:hypothetical protein|nr:hypothetical protein [Verrucomicrobiae bacterium]